MTLNQWIFGLLILTGITQATCILMGAGPLVGFLIVLVIIIGWCQIEPKP